MRVFSLCVGLGAALALASPAVCRSGPAGATAPVQAQGADDQYRYVIGLADQELWGQVVREAEAFLRRYGNDERADEVRYRLGVAHQELDQCSRAVESFETLAGRTRYRRWREASYRLARCRMLLGQPDEAVATLERLLRGGADYLKEPATLLLADAQLERGAFADAERAYQRVGATDDPAAAADVAWGLAWCAYRLERGDRVLQRAQDYLDRFGPTDATRAREMHFLRGEALLADGLYEDAARAYAQVAEGPLEAPALRGRGFALAGLEQHAEAAGMFDRALRADSEGQLVSECSLQAGVEHLKAGSPERALQRLTHRSLDADPEALYWRARAQAQAGQHAQALATLDQALARRPEGGLERRIRSARGDALSTLGRKDEAVRAWSDAGSTRGRFNAAVASLEDGRRREAAELAEGLLADGARGVEATELALILGEARFAQADYAAAEPAYTRALEGANESPSSVSVPHVTLRLGWCRWFADDPARAAEHFERVARGGTEEAREAQFMLARAHLAAGDSQAAGEAFRGYLERYPQGLKRADALLALSQIESPEVGLQRLETLVERHPTHPLAPEAMLDLADRYSSGQDCERAIATYRALLARPASPQHAPARYGLAWCSYDVGRFDQALAAIEGLLSDREASRELVLAANELAVWSEIGRGNASGASAAFTALLERVPDASRWLDLSRKLIELLRQESDPNPARRVVQRMIELEAERPDPYCAASLAVEEVYLELEVGQIDEAQAALGRAHASLGTLARRAQPRTEVDALLPRVAEASFFVGEARFDAGEFESAATLYANAQQGGQSAVAERALYKGGFACLSKGDPKAAAERFTRLIEEHPESTLRLESIFLVGEAQYRAGMYEEAAVGLERLRRTARRHEVMPKAMFRLGLAYGQLERWADCAEVLTQLAKDSAEFPYLAEAELWRGRANARLGRGDASRRALARVIELDRGELSAAARIELGKLARTEGDLERALSEFLRVSVLYETETVAEALLLAGEVLEEQGDVQGAVGRYEELVKAHPDSPFARTAGQRMNKLRAR